MSLKAEASKETYKGLLKQGSFYDRNVILPLT